MANASAAAKGLQEPDEADEKAQLALMADRARGLSLAAAMSPTGLTDFEFDLVTATHAFQRWIVRSTAATHLKDLSAIDALVVQQIGFSGSDKSLADLSFILNIEDTHVVAYSLRKLVSLGIVTPNKHGKEVLYSATALGQEYLELYQGIREECLLHPIGDLQINPIALKELAQYLRKLSGLYDQAARAVSSF